MRMTVEKRTPQSQPDPDLSTERRSAEARRRTVTRQEQRRIGFALSAFVVHVCEL